MTIGEIIIFGVIIFLLSFIVTLALRWFKKKPGTPYDPREDGSDADADDDVWDKK